MTAPLSHQTVTEKDNAAARKRRRRAPAGGAADDCFTCSKRNVKCDRRRPYCSQCLEIGNECSGYKTQLTWGVGVASRGKLRGLSLPIAKAPPVPREIKKSPARSRASSNAASQHQHQNHQPQQPLPQPPRLHQPHHQSWSEHDEMRRTPRGPIDIPNVTHAASAPTTPYPVHGYDYLSMSHPDSAHHMPQGSWSSVGSVSSVQYSPGLVHSPDTSAKYPKYSLHLVTEGLPSSVDSVGSAVGSEIDYMSPISQPYSRDEMAFVNSPSLMYDSYHSAHQTSPGRQSPPSSIAIDHSRAPTSCPGLVYAPSEPSSSLNSHMDPFESHLGHKMMRECDNLSVPQVETYGSSVGSLGDMWPPHPKEEDVKPTLSDQAQHQWPSPLSAEPQPIRVSPELAAKMPFFMDYYKMTICPSMVFIDGPTNPFREHVLQLATNSQSLQHAICALSACNLRMKRRLSLGQDTRELSEKLMAEKQAAEAVPDTQLDDQALSEEYQHRNLAVNLLNQQLNDPVKSSNDSVLATILLLCHYRMVECGIAKFHTQFAGVKKILSMRNQNFGHSGDSTWMESLFTYFDAISASINDREAQLTSPSLNVELLPPGVENFVGCDRELFKTISKLGRLNLLAQHRPVRSTDEGSRSQSPLLSPSGPISKDSPSGVSGQQQQQQQRGDMYSLPPHRFDGNGFGSTLGEDELLSSAMASSGAYDDHRSMFWREWKEARLALQYWQFDSSAMAESMPGSPSLSQVRDIGSVSEAFRYAALLYTERLANPNMSSSHSNFQNLVSQVVYYATSLESGSMAEKFLLWPMFVAGSECVNELQQDIVRSKCRDIMARSGYMNNLAALDVLESLWADETKDGEPQSPGSKIPGRGGPFNWVKCIGGLDVDVEWIMF